MLLVNVLRPVAAGEKLAPEAFDKMLDQISEVKHELAPSAAAGEGETAERKTQRREAVIPFFRWRVYGRGSRVKALRFAPTDAPKTRGLDPAPSPLLFASSQRKM